MILNNREVDNYHVPIRSNSNVKYGLWNEGWRVLVGGTWKRGRVVSELSTAAVRHD